MKIMIAGGGTGGHLFAAVAIAEEFKSRLGNDCEILFIISRRGIDKDLVPKLGYPWEEINVSPLKGQNTLRRIINLFRLPLSLFRAWRIVRFHKPDIALGIGGYTAGPALLAAKILGVPTAATEQNSIPGFTNRMLSKFVDRIFITFEMTKQFLPGKKLILTGNPVRQSILQAESVDGHDGFNLVIIGGSQGARSVNQAVVKALPELKKEIPGIKITHQTGNLDYDEVCGEYKKLGIEANIGPFFKDMASIFSKADLTISRAGSSSLSELAVIGKPAILIPYPLASDDHQRYNALEFANNGAAEMISNSDLTGDRLAKLVIGLSRDGERRKRMATKMKELGKPDAAKRIVDHCLELILRRPNPTIHGKARKRSSLLSTVRPYE